MTVTAPGREHHPRSDRPQPDRAGRGTVTPADGPEPPNDVDAEQVVLGTALMYPDVVAELRHLLDPDAFYRPAHKELWDVIVTTHGGGNAITADTAWMRLSSTRGVPSIPGVDGGYLATLISRWVAASAAVEYARRVRDAAVLRSIAESTGSLRQRALAPDADPIELTHAMNAMLEERVAEHATHAVTATARDIDTFLDADDEEYDWLIPALLERGDRVVLTAEEGAGKSTLGRQLAIQSAAGLHIFTGHRIDPVRVLLLDLENSERQMRRALRPLRDKAGDRLNPDLLRVESRIQGIDLTQDADQLWLRQLVADARPHLLITGPVYKMANGDPTEEKSAKPVAMFLDQLRADYRCTVWLEAHAAKAPAGTKTRPHEPYGWSGWLRWPEFGLWLDKDGALEHWRGDRDQRDWPLALVRGGHGNWPWGTAQNPDDHRWEAIRKATLNAGRKLSIRELADATGMSKSTVSNVLSARSVHYAALVYQVGEAP